jgi:hypothetical protein
LAGTVENHKVKMPHAGEPLRGSRYVCALRQDGERGVDCWYAECTVFDAKGSAKWRELPSFMELVEGQLKEYRGRQFGSDSSVFILFKCTLCSHEE